MGTSNSVFAFTGPGFPGPWMGWVVLLAIRYGVPAAAGNGALARAALMPAYTPGQRRAAGLHSLTALLALVMSLFVRMQWEPAAVSRAGLAATATGLAAYG